MKQSGPNGPILGGTRHRYWVWSSISEWFGNKLRPDLISALLQNLHLVLLNNRQIPSTIYSKDQKIIRRCFLRKL